MGARLLTELQKKKILEMRSQVPPASIYRIAKELNINNGSVVYWLNKSIKKEVADSEKKEVADSELLEVINIPREIPPPDCSKPIYAEDSEAEEDLNADGVG